MILQRLASVAVMLLAGQAVSAETGRLDVVFSTDLVVQGFAPFATSGAGNATFGMKRETDMHLRFIAYEPAAAAKRQQVLVAELNGTNPDWEVPNIPVVCVLTQ